MDISVAWNSVRQMVNSAIAAAPRLLLAAVVLLIAVGAGRLVRRLVQRSAAERREHGNLQLALGRIAMVGTILVGALIAATVAFPNFTPGDLVSALGIGGVAIGFAFKDIFQNFLAGILILVTKPFSVGDQIVFKDYEGQVEDIQTRATYIKTYDGRRVVIPNGDLFVNSVIVNTAYPQRRVQYDIGIGYGDDIERARAIILQVLRDAEGVEPDPAADVIVVNLADSSVMLRARWWSSSRMVDVLVTQDRVLTEVKHRLQAAGIDMPYPTRQILLHDQTEETDGNRRDQREGWPAGDGQVPRSRQQAMLAASSGNGRAATGVPRSDGQPAK